MAPGEVSIVRPLRDGAEVDEHEVGPMFEVRYISGPLAGKTRHAFGDELEWLGK